jgi:hypothetical protein
MKKSGKRLLGLLILVGCMGTASAEPPKGAWTDEQIEGWVFGDNATKARQRMESRLANQILDLDRACNLKDKQKKKLHSAGRGDIKRFFAQFDEFKRKVLLTQHDVQKMQRIYQEIPVLQETLQFALFQEDSLLIKSLPNTLTSEQFARYDAMARERRAARHRESIAKAVEVLQRGTLVRDAQRRELLALLTSETRPSTRPSPYEPFVLLLQLDRLPEGKLKGLFDQDQWRFVSQELAHCHQLEPMLKRAGLLPADGD